MNYQLRMCVLIMIFIIQLPVFPGGRSEFLEDLSEGLKENFSLLVEPSRELQRFTGHSGGADSVFPMFTMIVNCTEPRTKTLSIL